MNFQILPAPHGQRRPSRRTPAIQVIAITKTNNMLQPNQWWCILSNSSQQQQQQQQSHALPKAPRPSSSPSSSWHPPHRKHTASMSATHLLFSTSASMIHTPVLLRKFLRASTHRFAKRKTNKLSLTYIALRTVEKLALNTSSYDCVLKNEAANTN